MSHAMPDKPLVGISACLLGQEVRYDGGHKRNIYVTNTLAEHCELVSFCPEVGVGLPIPRPPIRLIRGLNKRKGTGKNAAADVRAVRVDEPGTDYTQQLADYADSLQERLQTLAGFIVKKDSPSCGMERVKVYDDVHEGSNGGSRPPERSGTGIFTARLLALFPWLPVEEEGRLSDPRLRENFVVRVFTLHRWHQLIFAGLTPARLVKFHERHKFLIQAHHETLYRELGRLVADAGKGQLEVLGQQYLETLMQALAHKTTPGKGANVLMHIMGFVKEQLNVNEKAELLGLIDDYQAGLVPMIVPVTLMNHFLRRFPQPYIGQQYFLEPHPRELMLRNHI